MNQREEDRSLGELLAELADEFTALVRQELSLASTELAEKVSQIGRDIGILAAGGMVVYAGLLAIIAALILGLAAIGLPGWLSALLVGLAVVALGYYLIRRGLNDLRRRNLVPEQTIASLRKGGRWTKAQMR